MRPDRAAVLYWLMRAGRPGQNTTEYFLLLCAMLTVFGVVGGFLKSYTPLLMERAFALIVDAALQLALP